MSSYQQTLKLVNFSPEGRHVRPYPISHHWLRIELKDLFLEFLYIFGAIIFTVYGQLILKWRVVYYGSLPVSVTDKAMFFGKLLIDPFIISGFVAAFLAFLCWMAAMTKLELSFAYPFMSLSFVLVLVLSGLFFHEPITLPKITGMILIVAGIIVSVQG